MDDYEEEISTESDLLDGERYSDFDETPIPSIANPPISQPTKPQSKQSAPAAKKFQKPNFQGVRKYVATVMEELQAEYPDSSDKELRAVATRRWHDLTEDERIDYLAVDLKEIFTIYDTEGTGNVSLTRLGDLLRSSGLNPTEKQIKELVESKGGFANSIDFETFKAVHGVVREGERPAAEEMEEFRMVMKAFDHDGTGMISIEELKGVLIRIGDGLSEQEADDILRMFAKKSPSGYLHYERTSEVCMESGQLILLEFIEAVLKH